jgi:hypothetical protein
MFAGITVVMSILLRNSLMGARDDDGAGIAWVDRAVKLGVVGAIRHERHDQRNVCPSRRS